MKLLEAFCHLTSVSSEARTRELGAAICVSRARLLDEQNLCALWSSLIGDQYMCMKQKLPYVSNV